MRMTYRQVYELARSVGCTEQQAVIATAIAAAESDLNPHNYGDATLAPHGSRGLWQVFTGAHPMSELHITSWDELYDPVVNARCMWAISGHGTNWHPWSTYTSDAYIQHLSDARAAAGQQQGESMTSGHVIWRGYTFDARTRDMLVEVAKRCRVTVTPVQGSYSHGTLSAGTHSGGGAVDIHVIGLGTADILQIVHVMREVGFAAWWRRTPEWTDAQHIHGIAVGCPDLNPIAAQQVVALRKGYNGLGHLGEGGKDRHADMHLPVITWETYQANKRKSLAAKAKAAAVAAAAAAALAAGAHAIPSTPPPPKPPVATPAPARPVAPAPAPAPARHAAYPAKLSASVRPNHHAAGVHDLQRALVAVGYLKLAKTTDLYGPATQAAVAHFLSNHPQYRSYPGDKAIGARGWTALVKLAVSR